MTAAIEEALKGYLATALSATQQIIGEDDAATSVMACEIAGVKVSLHANTGQDTIPDHTPLILVMAGEFPHVVGGLYNGKIDIVISTPQRVSGLTVATHSAIVAAVHPLFDLTSKKSTISSALTATGYTSTGWFEDSVRDNHEGSRWRTMISFDPFGVEKV